MSDQAGSLSQTLRHLKNRPAWGLTRTHGSTFFLEIGNPKLRPGERKLHGEWHFLFEMCHWRFEDANTLLVGSDDSPQRINKEFRNLKLESVVHVETVPPSNDLQIEFSSGVRVRTFSTCSADAEATQWQLFDPSENVWISDVMGRILARDANE